MVTSTAPQSPPSPFYSSSRRKGRKQKEIIVESISHSDSSLVDNQQKRSAKASDTLANDGPNCSSIVIIVFTLIDVCARARVFSKEMAKLSELNTFYVLILFIRSLASIERFTLHARTRHTPDSTHILSARSAPTKTHLMVRCACVCGRKRTPVRVNGRKIDQSYIFIYSCSGGIKIKRSLPTSHTAVQPQLQNASTDQSMQQQHTHKWMDKKFAVQRNKNKK